MLVLRYGFSDKRLASVTLSSYRSSLAIPFKFILMFQKDPCKVFVKAIHALPKSEEFTEFSKEVVTCIITLTSSPKRVPSV